MLLAAQRQEITPPKITLWRGSKGETIHPYSSNATEFNFFTNQEPDTVNEETDLMNIRLPGTINDSLDAIRLIAKFEPRFKLEPRQNYWRRTVDELCHVDALLQQDQRPTPSQRLLRAKLELYLRAVRLSIHDAHFVRDVSYTVEDDLRARKRHIANLQITLDRQQFGNPGYEGKFQFRDLQPATPTTVALEEKFIQEYEKATMQRSTELQRKKKIGSL